MHICKPCKLSNSCKSIHVNTKAQHVYTQTRTRKNPRCTSCSKGGKPVTTTWCIFINKVSLIHNHNVNINKLHEVYINLMASNQTWSYRKARQYLYLLKQMEYIIMSHVEKQNIFKWEDNLIIILNVLFLFMKHDKRTHHESITL